MMMELWIKNRIVVVANNDIDVETILNAPARVKREEWRNWHEIDIRKYKLRVVLGHESTSRWSAQ